MQNETSMFANLSLVRLLRLKIIPVCKTSVCFWRFFIFSDKSQKFRQMLLDADPLFIKT